MNERKMRGILRKRYPDWYTSFRSKDVADAYAELRSMSPGDWPMAVALKADMQELDDADLLIWFSMPSMAEDLPGVTPGFFEKALSWLRGVMAEELLREIP